MADDPASSRQVKPPAFSRWSIYIRIQFEIWTGFNAADRLNLRRWPLVKYKHFPAGTKKHPRHPVFLGFRSRLDR
jgi:hypothetical protein